MLNTAVELARRQRAYDVRRMKPSALRLHRDEPTFVS